MRVGAIAFFAERSATTRASSSRPSSTYESDRNGVSSSSSLDASSIASEYRRDSKRNQTRSPCPCGTRGSRSYGRLNSPIASSTRRGTSKRYSAYWAWTTAQLGFDSKALRNSRPASGQFQSKTKLMKPIDAWASATVSSSSIAFEAAACKRC